jgi:hypothetical protein
LQTVRGHIAMRCGFLFAFHRAMRIASLCEMLLCVRLRV